MSLAQFPESLRLHDPERRKALIQQVYEEHHGKHSSKYEVAVDGARKIDFLERC